MFLGTPRPSPSLSIQLYLQGHSPQTWYAPSLCCFSVARVWCGVGVDVRTPLSFFLSGRAVRRDPCGRKSEEEGSAVAGGVSTAHPSCCCPSVRSRSSAPVLHAMGVILSACEARPQSKSALCDAHRVFVWFGFVKLPRAALPVVCPRNLFTLGARPQETLEALECPQALDA